MNVVILIYGQMYDVLEIAELPSLGEVVRMLDADMVVTSIHFPDPVTEPDDLPAISLLPILIPAGMDDLHQ